MQVKIKTFDFIKKIAPNTNIVYIDDEFYNKMLDTNSYITSVRLRSINDYDIEFVSELEEIMYRTQFFQTHFHLILNTEDESFATWMKLAYG